MAKHTGKKGGRPRLPVELHLLKGSYRPDRHGPIPAPQGAPSLPAAAAVTLPDDATPGERFTAAVQAAWRVDDPLGRLHVAAAARALDARALLDGLLDGPHGLVAKLAGGRSKVSAKAVEVVLRARRDVIEQFETALAELDLQPASATDARKGMAR